MSNLESDLGVRIEWQVRAVLFAAVALAIVVVGLLVLGVLVVLVVAVLVLVALAWLWSSSSLWWLRLLWSSLVPAVEVPPEGVRR